MTEPDRNQLAIGSLAAGIAGLCLILWRWIPIVSLVFTVLALAAAIPAVVTGHIALQRVRREGGPGRTAAWIGLLAGYATLAVAIIAPVLTLAVLLGGGLGWIGEHAPSWFGAE